MVKIEVMKGCMVYHGTTTNSLKSFFSAFYYQKKKNWILFSMDIVKKSFPKTLLAYSLPKNWHSLQLELMQITFSDFQRQQEKTICGIAHLISWNRSRVDQASSAVYSKSLSNQVLSNCTSRLFFWLSKNRTSFLRAERVKVLERPDSN